MSKILIVIDMQKGVVNASAAKRLGHHYLGFDHSPIYVEMAQQRINQFFNLVER